MDSLHVRAKELNGIDGIGLAVENQVCEIEVDALIVQAHVLNRAHQRDRRLLAGLVPKILAVVLAVGGDLSHRRDRFLVNWIVWILGDESAVRLHRGDAALFGKVRRLFDMGDARISRLPRN